MQTQPEILFLKCMYFELGKNNAESLLVIRAKYVLTIDE